MLKYKINELLGRMHGIEKRNALKDLEKILRCGRTRLNVIRRAKIGDRVFLKDTQLRDLAKYFDTSMEKLINNEKNYN